jgi:hypothetical protein
LNKINISQFKMILNKILRLFKREWHKWRMIIDFILIYILSLNFIYMSNRYYKIEIILNILIINLNKDLYLLSFLFLTIFSILFVNSLVNFIYTFNKLLKVNFIISILINLWYYFFYVILSQSRSFKFTYQNILYLFQWNVTVFVPIE